MTGRAARAVGLSNTRQRPARKGDLLLNNLGRLLVEMGEVDRAQAPLLEALEIRRDLLGNKHTDVANSLQQVARWHHAVGQDAEAVPLLEEAIRIRQSPGSDEHLIAQSMNDLAVMLKDMQKYAQAESYASQAVELYRSLFHGEPHYHLALSLNTLASVQDAAGDFDQAESAYLDCIAVFRSLDQDGKPGIAFPLLNLGQAYLKVHKADKAEPLLNETLEVWSQALPEGHWKLAYALGALGECYLQQGRLVEAESSLLESHAQISQTLGEEHPLCIRTIQRIVSLYEGWNKREKRDKWRAKLPDED